MKKVCFEKGITLISVVITIIIMLILVGIVLNISLGNNSVLNKAKVSVKTNEEQAIKEIILLAANEIKIKNSITPMSTEDIKLELYKEITKNSDNDVSVEIYENNYLIKAKEYIFEIPSELNSVSCVTNNDKIVLEKSFQSEKILYDCEAKFAYNTAIKIEFDNETVNSKSLVNIYVFDSNDNFIKSYSNKALAGKTIYINDKGVKFKIQSLKTVSNYLFKCTIHSTNEISYQGMETPHPYKNNCEYAFTNYIKDANQVLMKFSIDSKIHNRDMIGMYSFKQYSDTQWEQLQDRIIKLNDGVSDEIIISKNTSTIVLSSNNIKDDSLYGIKFSLDKYETPDNILESFHNYENNLNGKIYEKTIDGAKAIKLSFDKDTCFKSGDWIDIYYNDSGEDILVGKYIGDELSKREIFIPANNVKIKLYSGNLGSDYGFRCLIDEIDGIQYIGDEVIVESPHSHINQSGIEEFGYGNNQVYNYDVNIEDNIDGLCIIFDENSHLDDFVDVVNILNENDEIIGSFSGEIGQKTIYLKNINNIHFKMETDDSQEFWGFKCTIKGYKIMDE